MFGYEIHNLLDKVPHLHPHFRGIATIDSVVQLERKGDFAIVNTE